MPALSWKPLSKAPNFNFSSGVHMKCEKEENKRIWSTKNCEEAIYFLGYLVVFFGFNFLLKCNVQGSVKVISVLLKEFSQSEHTFVTNTTLIKRILLSSQKFSCALVTNSHRLTVLLTGIILWMLPKLLPNCFHQFTLSLWESKSVCPPHPP